MKLKSGDSDTWYPKPHLYLSYREMKINSYQNHDSSPCDSSHCLITFIILYLV